MQLNRTLQSCLHFFHGSNFTTLLFLLFIVYTLPVRAQREIVLNTTGYGFDRTTANGIHPGQWEYIQKFAKLKYNGKDASVTAVRLHIQWHQYEPMLGAYERKKFALAIKTILDLNPNMKVALHFSYLRQGYWNDDYLSTADIAQLSNGTFLRDPISDTHSSIFSDYAIGRFLGFVDDALAQVQPYASRILYTAMGTTSSEEFYMPVKVLNSVTYSGMYEAKALQAWRTKFLPATYPGQTNVTWGRQTYPISSAPQPTDGNYNSEIGRDLHRFAGWGLLKLFKGFYDTVKSRNSSIRVLHFISDFGTTQGNNWHLHSSTIPLALELSDGIYHTDGNFPSDIWRKIMGIDCIKGTFSQKIAAVEFDPVDLGQGNVPGIDGNIGVEWFARAFKHGAEYVHLAMHYDDVEIQQIAPAIAACREQFIKPSYQPPARQAAIKVNINPTVFTGQYLFDEWGANGGQNFGQTDQNPVSIKMTDSGYWGKIWDSGDYLPCGFSVQARSSNTKPSTNVQVTLSVNCNGGECDEASFSWTGEGLGNRTGKSITFNTPGTAGKYTYSVKSNRSGCGTKTASTALDVTPALPVTLIRFSATRENETSSLAWATSEEENSERFEIERSPDGKQWTTIGTVQASGETSETITPYWFTDSKPLTGQNLYRLKMIDQDQTFAYSRMVSLNFGGASLVMTYPNPATDKITITDAKWESVRSIHIISNSGSVVYKSEQPEPDVDVQNLTSGSYVISLIRDNGEQENGKFVKE
jgi:hypothetical protein